jgi:UDP-4-amino-4-deoxy-L-arabinose formyltransferase/UDP-glucuronic acid dehydrogenase (UDP-4-keto-hexauronic acid decarboxylating)
MNPVVLFGSVPLATWAGRRVQSHPGLDLVGVVCDPVSRAFAHHGLDEPGAYDWAREHGVPVLTLEDVPGAVDGRAGAVGLSVRFHRILRRDVIDAFGGGVLNLHGGELPRFRGVNCANHAVLDGAERGAGTLHFIDEGVDTGDIVGRRYFEITRRDTAYSVFLKTQRALQDVLVEHLDAIAAGEVHRTPQDRFLADGETTVTYRRADLVRYKELSLDLGLAELDRRARAFAFPGHEPAYFRVGDRRLHLVPDAGGADGEGR